MKWDLTMWKISKGSSVNDITKKFNLKIKICSKKKVWNFFFQNKSIQKFKYLIITTHDAVTWYFDLSVPTKWFIFFQHYSLSFNVFVSVLFESLHDWNVVWQVFSTFCIPSLHLFHLHIFQASASTEQFKLFKIYLIFNWIFQLFSYQHF